MSPHVISSLLQRQKLPTLPVILLALFASSCVVGLWISTAQSAQQEREFKDTTPQHLPIKIKLKNAEKVKDLKNENWLRDLEIEVENKSNKPIYFLELFVELSDVTTEDNHNIGFPLQYGRGDLLDWVVPLQPDDVPIKPGETYTFKVSEDHCLGWERHAARVGLPKNVPKKVRLIFVSLNFGDGTGFGTTKGVPVNVHEPPLSSCGQNKEKDGLISAQNEPPNHSPVLPLQLRTYFLPAKFLPVNFSPAITTPPASNSLLSLTPAVLARFALV